MPRAMPASLNFPSLSKKKILLIDTHATTRDLRAKIMRKLGMEVESAAGVNEARSVWHAKSYDLILVDVRNDGENLEKFCDEMRNAKFPQSIAFLVGKPGYLASAPSVDGATEEGVAAADSLWEEMVVALYSNACDGLPRRWGFIEASWRIAATRSLKDPRNKIPVEGDIPRWSWAAAVKQQAEKVAV